MRTIGDVAVGKDNNLTLMRFMAASAVIWGHSFDLAYGRGGGHDPVSTALYPLIGMGLPGVAVSLFFVVSGFLVTASFVHRQNLLAYVEARVLRLFPGLAIAVLFTVFVVGAWATALPLAEYLRHPQVWDYVVHNTSLIGLRYHLPGVFESNPWPGGVNGSLWTLPVELLMYCWVALLGVLGILSNRVALNLFLFVAVLLYLQSDTSFLLVGGKAQNVRYVAMFGLGAFLYMNRRYIPFNIPILAALVLLALLLKQTDYFNFALYVAFAYGVLVIAYHPAFKLPNLDRIGDFSYGLYIYAFPVQQSIIHIFDGIGPLKVIVIAFPVTLGLAVLSWFLVERPALRLKGKMRYGIRWQDPRA